MIKLDYLIYDKYNVVIDLVVGKYSNKVDWYDISMYQKLSEQFIEKYSDKFSWFYISKFQKLSEEFIKKYDNKVIWYNISKYQRLSSEFIKKFNIYINPNNWLYKSIEFKKNKVIEIGLYECYDDYFIAYKGIRRDRRSRFSPHYYYEKGKTYESYADYTEEENSFGLSAWTEEKAKEYCDELVVRVKIYYEDVARIVHNNGKIRCCRQTILD